MKTEKLLEELTSLAGIQAMIDCISDDLQRGKRRYSPIDTVTIFSLLKEEGDTYYAFDVVEVFNCDIETILERDIEGGDRDYFLKNMTSVFKQYKTGKALEKTLTKLNKLDEEGFNWLDVVKKNMGDEKKFIDAYGEVNGWVHANVENGGCMSDEHVYTFTATDGNEFCIHTDYLGFVTRSLY